MIGHDVVRAIVVAAVLYVQPAALAAQVSPAAPGPSRNTGPVRQPTVGASSVDVAELMRRLSALERKVSDLEDEKAVLEIRLSALDSKNRTVSLDPSSPRKFQRLDGDSGFFLVSLESVEPYLDGFRVGIDIGNLGSARYEGFTLKATWGPRYDWNKVTAETYKKWTALKQQRDLSFSESIRPGVWNRVSLILPATPAAQMGFLELSIETNTVSFGGR